MNAEINILSKIDNNFIWMIFFKLQKYGKNKKSHIWYKILPVLHKKIHNFDHVGKSQQTLVKYVGTSYHFRSEKVLVVFLFNNNN